MLDALLALERLPPQENASLTFAGGTNHIAALQDRRTPALQHRVSRQAAASAVLHAYTSRKSKLVAAGTARPTSAVVEPRFIPDYKAE
jgi:hypothetical protein